MGVVRDKNMLILPEFFILNGVKIISSPVKVQLKMKIEILSALEEPQV